MPRTREPMVLLLIAAAVVAYLVFVANSVPSQVPSSPPVGAQHPRSAAWRQSPPKIVFKDQATPRGSVPPALGAGLAGLRDAVTGASLEPGRILFRCGRCQVYYHADSYQLLREENAGRCVGCGGVSIVAAPAGAGGKPAGRNYEADVTTLADYRRKVGQVVVFEGQCVRVQRSRAGTAFAVMFENESWTRGFKMVVLPQARAAVGGEAFLLSLAGRRLRVRGLVVQNRRYGYQIVVTDRSMILGVW